MSLWSPVCCPGAGTDSDGSLYDRIGGEKVKQLVSGFYARVDTDPVIRSFYGKTLTCAIHALTDFMTTWLGGPPVYDPPATRLRHRHVPFPIDSRARDAWPSVLFAWQLTWRLSPESAYRFSAQLTCDGQSAGLRCLVAVPDCATSAQHRDDL